MKILKLFLLLGPFIFPKSASAYLDPGTTSSVFTVMSSLLPGIAFFFGVIFLPLKRLAGWLKGKISRKSKKYLG